MVKGELLINWWYPSLSKSATGLNSEFSFSWTGCHTKIKEPSLLYYLLIVEGRIVGFIPFPRVLTLCEMQIASFSIWTGVGNDEDNCYTMSTSWPLPPKSWSVCVTRRKKREYINTMTFNSSIFILIDILNLVFFHSLLHSFLTCSSLSSSLFHFFLFISAYWKSLSLSLSLSLS